MVDVDLALGGSHLMRCSLLTSSTAGGTHISHNHQCRLLKLGGGGGQCADRLAVTEVMRALNDMFSVQSQEPLPRLWVSVTAAAVTGGRPAQLQLAVVVDTVAPHCMLLRAEQASRTCCRCCVHPIKWANCTKDAQMRAEVCAVGGCVHATWHRLKPAIVHPIAGAGGCAAPTAMGATGTRGGRHLGVLQGLAIR